MELAQYTIRSKQDYIFKTNKIIEIVGASVNISKAWDILFEEAAQVGVTVIRESDEDAFRLESARKRSNDGALIIELFRGGGNLTVLYDSAMTFRRVNRAFSYRLMTDYPGMIPMAVSTAVTEDYQADYRRLMQTAETEKNRMHPGQDQFILPFSMMDRDTFAPLTQTDAGSPGGKERTTAESLSKRKTGRDTRDQNDPHDMVKMLDDMTTDHGKESLLAVVHADGNNMGSKIMTMLGNDTSYDSCVKKMRRFTKDCASAFGKTALAAIEERRKKLTEENEKKEEKKKLKKSAFAYRRVIEDGDDMTFICNARFAMEYTKVYLEAVDRYDRSEWKYSSCAGICIFHSHYPFARAYKMAEQACDDGAKEMVHVTGPDGKPLNPEEGWVDFHYIHSGISGDLKELRAQQATGEAMARPWRITGTGSTEKDYQNLCRLQDIFRKYDVSRSVIKNIGNEWESSHVEGKRILDRVLGRKHELKEKLEELFSDEDTWMKAIYDLSEVYDVWFEEV